MKILKVLDGVFGKEKYVKMVELINGCINLEYYYKKVSKLLSGNEMYNMLKVLYSKSHVHYDLKIDDKLILLTHCGDKQVLHSRKILNKDYKLESKYNFGIMGHMTLPYLEKCILAEDNPVPLIEILEDTNNIEGISVEGKYKFLKVHSTFLIDDGSHSNIFKLELL